MTVTNKIASGFKAKLVTGLMVMCSVFASATAQATTYEISGTIHKMVAKHIQLNSNGQSGAKVFLNSGQSAGSCPKAESRVIVWIREDAASERMYTTLLAAKLAGQVVTIAVDDTYKDNQGVCYLQRVVIQ